MEYNRNSDTHSRKSVFFSEQIGDVHRHLLYLRVVELFDVTQNALIFVGHKIDRGTFATESTTTTDTAREETCIISVVPCTCFEIELTDEDSFHGSTVNRS